MDERPSKPCGICGFHAIICRCQACKVCLEFGRKECAIEHGLESLYVIRGVADVLVSRIWLFQLLGQFLADESLPSPKMGLGRESLILAIGMMKPVGIEMPFPATRCDIVRARELLHDEAGRATTLRN